MKNQHLVQKIRENICSVIVGKEKIIDYLLTAVIADGHILLEDVPGTGKTMMAKTFARSVEGSFGRIQFTPDLLPSDVTGINYYNQKISDFVFRKGPVFGNILLADEINRATPRTQSSLLEAMEERQVTVDGTTYKLEAPFLVIATQNPIETAGTFQLPEAQLDRFLMKIKMGYPDMDEEYTIIERFLVSSPLNNVEPVCTTNDIINMQQEAKNVYIHPLLKKYITSFVHYTRTDDDIAIGVSTRGTLTMVNAVRAFAYVHGRNYVVPEDIRSLEEPVFGHRIILKPSVALKVSKEEILKRADEKLKMPTEDWSEIL